MTESQKLKVLELLIDDYTRANTASPELARQTLINEGIYTPEGELQPEYGGPQPVSSRKNTGSRD